MGASVQPISSAAMSSLIQELEEGSSALFGDPFAGSGPSPGSAVGGGKLARVLNLLRRKVVPKVWRSLNLTKITVVYRSRVTDPDDRLNSSFSEGTVDVFAVVSGPSAEALEKGFLSVSDYEVLIPAYELNSALDENDAIMLDGASHDIVGIQAHPKTPPAVAYRYWAKRVA